MSSTCRTCLNASFKGLQALSKIATDDEDKPQKSYAQLLNEVANINIKNDASSKLPQFICIYCSRKLKAAYAFVQQAQNANEKLYYMLVQQSGASDTKQVDCLQETQIDIDSCLQIKLECEDGEENESMDGDNTMDNELMGKNSQLKKEVKEDEDALETTNCQIDKEFSSSNIFRNYLNASPDDLDIRDKIILDTENNVLNTPPKNSDVTDDNSVKDITSDFSTDNDELQKKRKISNKKRKIKKTSSIKVLKKAKTSKEELRNVVDDESLPAKCEDCDKVFANSRLLNRHKRGTHVPEDLKIQCLHCEVKFSRRHNMYAHMRQIHKSENLEDLQLQNKKVASNKQYPCQECSRSYTNKYKLIAHVKSHHNPDNKTSANTDKTLQPRRRFLCTLCGLTFESQSNLNIHFRRHTGEKPYKCDFCDRAYHRLYDLQVHRRSHTGEKPYQCNLCEKAFRRSNKLKIHLRTHTNERPYKCTQCEKAFKQSKDLNIHKRTHTGERPYKCGVCQSTFTQSNSLRLHQVKQKHFETSAPVGNIASEVPLRADLEYLKIM